MKPFEQQTAEALRNLRVLVVILAVATLAAMGFTALGFAQSTSIISSNCRQIEHLKIVIRQVVVASAHKLGQPGTSGYSYYRDHPQELIAAKVAALTEARQFSPQTCS